MMRNLSILFGVGLIVVLAPLTAAAQVPAQIPIQGYITETDGTPYDAEVAIRFNLYDAPTAGTELFSERQSVPVDRGVFTAYLGAVEALDMGLFADNTNVYLGVQVGADAEAAPRLMFGSVPFAAVSGMAGSFGGVDAADFPTTIEEWAMAACPDTIEELTAILDPVYANPAWDAITGIPEDIADGDDGFTTEEELTALLDDNYRAGDWVPAWGDVTGIPADIADGDDEGITTEEELTALLDDNYTYTADAPIAIEGTTVSLSGAGCEEGEVLQWDGVAWECAAGQIGEEAVEEYITNGPIDLNEDSTIGGEEIALDGHRHETNISWSTGGNAASYLDTTTSWRRMPDLTTNPLRITTEESLVRFGFRGNIDCDGRYCSFYLRIIVDGAVCGNVADSQGFGRVHDHSNSDIYDMYHVEGLCEVDAGDHVVEMQYRTAYSSTSDVRLRHHADLGRFLFWVEEL